MRTLHSTSFLPKNLSVKQPDRWQNQKIKEVGRDLWRCLGLETPGGTSRGPFPPLQSRASQLRARPAQDLIQASCISVDRDYIASLCEPAATCWDKAEDSLFCKCALDRRNWSCIGLSLGLVFCCVALMPSPTLSLKQIREAVLISASLHSISVIRV